MANSNDFDSQDIFSGNASPRSLGSSRMSSSPSSHATTGQSYSNEPGPGGIIPSQQLANKYHDSLDLRYAGSNEFTAPIPFELYRNNLTVFSEDLNLYFVATKSNIAVFEWDSVKGVPSADFSGIINATPTSVNYHEMQGANWPAYPHSFNFIKMARLRGIEVLLGAADDGKVLVWPTEIIAENIAKQAHSSTHILELRPALRLETEMSAWGIDVEETDCLIAVSDNSRQIAIFRVDPTKLKTECLSKAGELLSPVFPHNVPDIQFVRLGPRVDETCHLVTVGIAHELVLLQFYWGGALKSHQEKHGYGLLEEDWLEAVHEEEDGQSLKGRAFAHGRVLHVDYLDEMGWTVNTFTEQDFKHVETLGGATGNIHVTADPVVARYQRENMKLGYSGDSTYPAARFSHYDVKTNLLKNASGDINWPPLELESQTTLVKNRKFKRQEYLESIGADSGDAGGGAAPLNEFLVFTGKLGVVLTRTDDFYCNASKVDVFGWDYGGRGSPMDRMSMAVPIPELSAIAVATQAGVVSIFRLVRFRSIFCLRQEYMFPESDMTQVRQEHVILGMTARKLALGHYRLLVLFYEGKIEAYDLKWRHHTQGTIDVVML